MATVGRWGVTRDEDGALSNPLEWPWYWRYPAGLLFVAASIAFAIWIYDAKSPWVAYALGGLMVLNALVLMRELGCLVLVLGVGWVFYALSDAFLPSIEVPIEWRLGALGIGVGITWFFAYTAYEKAKAQAKAVENIWNRLNRLEGNSFDGPATGLASLNERVHRLERKAGINEREWREE